MYSMETISCCWYAVRMWPVSFISQWQGLWMSVLGGQKFPNTPHVTVKLGQLLGCKYLLGLKQCKRHWFRRHAWDVFRWRDPDGLRASVGSGGAILQAVPQSRTFCSRGVLVDEWKESCANPLPPFVCTDETHVNGVSQEMPLNVWIHHPCDVKNESTPICFVNMIHWYVLERWYGRW
jgi:hypothetical protein